jgi:hypothetical protein
LGRLDPAQFHDPEIVRKIIANAAVVHASEGSAVPIKLKPIQLDE